MTHRQWHVVPKVEQIWTKSLHRRKRMRKDDPLAIKLMHTMQVSFPITLHFTSWMKIKIKDLRDQSVWKSNDYHVLSFGERISMNKKFISV